MPQGHPWSIQPCHDLTSVTPKVSWFLCTWMITWPLTVSLLLVVGVKVFPKATWVCLFQTASSVSTLSCPSLTKRINTSLDGRPISWTRWKLWDSSAWRLSESTGNKEASSRLLGSSDWCQMPYPYTVYTSTTSLWATWVHGHTCMANLIGPP
jgi:hypothetical protein